MGRVERQLIVIGGGVVEACSKGYRARNQIVEYLRGFLQYYSKVTWATICLDTENYITKLGDVGVEIINQNGPANIYSFSGIRDQLIHYRSFIKNIDSKTDVIIANVSLTSVLYVLVTKLLGGRLLLYMGSDPFLSVKVRKSLLRKILPSINLFFLPIVIFLADVVFVRGDATFSLFKKWNRRVFLSQPIISYSALKEFGGESAVHEGINLLYIGKIEENKGVHILIDAFERVVKKEKKKKIYLNIVGDGPEFKKLHKKTMEYGLNDAVTFHGFVDDIERLMEFFSRANLLIVPSIIHEGFPRVIDEAFACGVPVISSRVGGMKYLEGQEGVCLVEPGDTNGLAEALNRFVCDKNWRDQLRLTAKKNAREFLTKSASEQHAKAMLE